MGSSPSNFKFHRSSFRVPAGWISPVRCLRIRHDRWTAKLRLSNLQGLPWRHWRWNICRTVPFRTFRDGSCVRCWCCRGFGARIWCPFVRMRRCGGFGPRATIRRP
ncbi:uncharacterized protein LOC117790279 [Drosophila innubila]|uniref:uncharacterized protein LOC117790279 n=1 Tax=Drosophila innubila TaxID=198719 RepID=UPI00148E803B|nr:uncharacterized protein LOC117790279 [Drosophila innubila]